jgi:hypothetical protein
MKDDDSDASLSPEGCSTECSKECLTEKKTIFHRMQRMFRRMFARPHGKEVNKYCAHSVWQTKNTINEVQNYIVLKQAAPRIALEASLESERLNVVLTVGKCTSDTNVFDLKADTFSNQRIYSNYTTFHTNT